MRLDMAQLNQLPPADRDRYRALEQLFDHPGWKVVTQLAKQNAEASTLRAAFAASWADNRLAVGNGTAWNAIANLEEQTEAAYIAKLAAVAQEAARRALSEETELE